jgi:hypothetical protein
MMAPILTFGVPPTFSGMLESPILGDVAAILHRHKSDGFRMAMAT